MISTSRLLFAAAVGGCLFVTFWLLCGIFVIQPLGAIPDGTTIVYWRYDLNLPFIASADGILVEFGAGVSLLGRGLILAKIAEPVLERELFRLPYSQTLYEYSTGGVTFDR